jgi:hypothetical protein
MEDAKTNLDRWVLQVGVKRSQLVRGAERLVDDRAKGERGDVEIVAAVEALAGAEGSRLDAVGAEAWAAGPSASTSTGTERQERTAMPSARQASSTACRPAAPRRKTIAMPRPGSGKRAAGRGRRTPAPSPVR